MEGPNQNRFSSALSFLRFHSGRFRPPASDSHDAGICGIVNIAGQAAVIPEAEIEDVRRMVESFLHAEPHPFLKCGDRVRIKAGPLAGIEGILVRKKNQMRLVLSVELLAKSVAVEIDASMV